jgi:hypothetical protein
VATRLLTFFPEGAAGAVAAVGLKAPPLRLLTGQIFSLKRESGPARILVCSMSLIAATQEVAKVAGMPESTSMPSTKAFQTRLATTTEQLISRCDAGYIPGYTYEATCNCQG